VLTIALLLIVSAASHSIRGKLPEGKMERKLKVSQFVSSVCPGERGANSNLVFVNVTLPSVVEFTYG